jgi:endonuclease YncB( thermonuclease family)
MSSIKRTFLLSSMIVFLGNAPAFAQMSTYQQPYVNSQQSILNDSIPVLRTGGPAGALAAGYGSGENNSSANTGITEGNSYNTGIGVNPAISTYQNPSIGASPPPPPPEENEAAKKLLSKQLRGDNTEQKKASLVNQSANISQSIGVTLVGKGVALAPNKLSVDHKTVLVSGAATVSQAQECLTPQKTNWSCGAEATQYLQSLLDQGEVSCVTISSGVTPLAICHVGFDDVATGMNRWPSLSGFQQKVQKLRN